LTSAAETLDMFGSANEESSEKERTEES